MTSTNSRDQIINSYEKDNNDQSKIEVKKNNQINAAIYESTIGSHLRYGIISILVLVGPLAIPSVTIYDIIAIVFSGSVLSFIALMLWGAIKGILAHNSKSKRRM